MNGQWVHPPCARDIRFFCRPNTRAIRMDSCLLTGAITLYWTAAMRRKMVNAVKSSF